MTKNDFMELSFFENTRVYISIAKYIIYRITITKSGPQYTNNTGGKTMFINIINTKEITNNGPLDFSAIINIIR